MADRPEVVLIPERFAVQIGGEEVILTPTQYRLLAELKRESGRVFSRAQLVKAVFGGFVLEQTVDVHVKEMRRKLGQHRWMIETVRAIGLRYRDE